MLAMTMPGLETEARLRVEGSNDIVTVRQEARALATQLGFDSGDLTLIATAISEVARNVIEHAKGGEIVLKPILLNPKRGIQIMANDQGPGILDIDRAMQDGYSSGKGLGLGLPGAKRLMDEFEIASQVGKGTTVTMRKWVK